MNHSIALVIAETGCIPTNERQAWVKKRWLVLWQRFGRVFEGDQGVVSGLSVQRQFTFLIQQARVYLKGKRVRYNKLPGRWKFLPGYKKRD